MGSGAALSEFLGRFWEVVDVELTPLDLACVVTSVEHELARLDGDLPLTLVRRAWRRDIRPLIKVGFNMMN